MNSLASLAFTVDLLSSPRIKAELAEDDFRFLLWVRSELSAAETLFSGMCLSRLSSGEEVVTNSTSLLDTPSFGGNDDEENGFFIGSDSSVRKKPEEEGDPSFEGVGTELLSGMI